MAVVDQHRTGVHLKWIFDILKSLSQIHQSSGSADLLLEPARPYQIILLHRSSQCLRAPASLLPEHPWDTVPSSCFIVHSHWILHFFFLLLDLCFIANNTHQDAFINKRANSPLGRIFLRILWFIIRNTYVCSSSYSWCTAPKTLVIS